MRIVGLTITALLLVTAPANAQTTCSRYVDTVVAPRTFNDVVAGIPLIPPKSEFETTAQYEARVSSFRTSQPVVISKVIEDRKFLVYDADTGVLRVQSFAFDNTTFDAWDAFYGSNSGVTAGVSGNVDTVISVSETPAGSYSAQNSYGATATISKVTRTVSAIFQGQARSYLDGRLFVNATDRNDVLGLLLMTPAEAQTFKPQARIAFVVVPISPFVVRSTYKVNTPTISNPIDVTYNATILIADFQCGLLMDATNKVLAAYDTR